MRTQGVRSRRVGALVAAIMVWMWLALPVAADPSAGGPAPAHIHEIDQTGPVADGTGATFRVYGYQEGLVGHTTANGHVIQPNDHFVALPCFCVLSSKGGYEFQVKIEYKGTTVVAPVWDVGPWNVDDNYWDPPEQRRWSNLPQGVPEAAAAFYDGYNGGKDGWDRTVTSPGGIDIGDGTFADLGMTGSDWVTVTFLWLVPPHYDLPPLPSGWENLPSRYWDERPPLDDEQPAVDGRYGGYFWETGHNVPLEILDFWSANGGLKIWGYPVSAFHREARADGTIRYAQYFERGVLSMDLSGDTWPPLVQADLMGYTAYIDPGADAPIEPFVNTTTATYFAETGHSLQHGFKVFWEANGGLPTFGYPISEEWAMTMPNGRVAVVQIFERARFEWWPDLAGTGEEITLGLLTLEQLQRDGWIE